MAKVSSFVIKSVCYSKNVESVFVRNWETSVVTEARKVKTNKPKKAHKRKERERVVLKLKRQKKYAQLVSQGRVLLL